MPIVIRSVTEAATAAAEIAPAKKQSSTTHSSSYPSSSTRLAKSRSSSGGLTHRYMTPTRMNVSLQSMRRSHI